MESLLSAFCASQGSFVLGYLLPGHLELVIIAIVALLLFGHRLPSVMKSLGSSIKMFKSGMNEEDDEEEEEEVVVKKPKKKATPSSAIEEEEEEKVGK